jgi:hypothetical protein
VFGNTSIPDVDGGDGLAMNGVMKHFPGNPAFSRAWNNPVPHRLLNDSIK